MSSRKHRTAERVSRCRRLRPRRDRARGRGCGVSDCAVSRGERPGQRRESRVQHRLEVPARRFHLASGKGHSPRNAESGGRPAADRGARRRRPALPARLITRGQRGSLCYGRDEGFFEVPGFALRTVDRIGAATPCSRSGRSAPPSMRPSKSSGSSETPSGRRRSASLAISVSSNARHCSSTSRRC
jgi:hypothetical protein